ncbi:MAG: hypothetical protein M1834_002967 [Cirrosporium novae-zelandiae]|nr:MAG: hypothetical protein M1834_002967 [Cirrosporium novae-zelandiae]
MTAAALIDQQSASSITANTSDGKKDTMTSNASDDKGDKENGKINKEISTDKKANGKSAKDSLSAGSTGASSPPVKAETQSRAANSSSSPRKRRKVNHACVYCRRSERPCARCIKRDIGHLCHDEPRENNKKAKSEADQPAVEDGTSNTLVDGLGWKLDQQQADRQLLQESGLGLPSSSAPVPTTSITQPAPVTAASTNPPNSALLGYSDWGAGPQNQFQDMHHLHPSYMFNTSEVTNEYNLLGDFLSNSLIDDGMYANNEDVRGLYSDPNLMNSMALAGNDANLLPHGQQAGLMLPPPATHDPASSQPAMSVPTDKAREKYYMTAADPAGLDAPEERMTRLLKAKYDAGMLKPFNYVKGYARLNSYMEHNLKPESRKKILTQLSIFRPKFRERMKALTDIELVLVEMWFERSLMEYDRVFASMAIPACCWRRTGEIFRGNREMAELIHVPIETFREGKLAIHEIMSEDQLVSYWEKFGAIAFDPTQKAMLTTCMVKNPDPNSNFPEIHCCFSFTIRRDPHNIPAIIVGNFLPVVPGKK